MQQLEQQNCGLRWNFSKTERELRRLQLKKELAIANAKETAIKRILEDEKLLVDKEEIKIVKQESKAELSAVDIKQERSFSIDPNGPLFIPGNLTASKPLKPEPVNVPQYQAHDISTALQEIVNLQSKQS